MAGAPNLFRSQAGKLQTRSDRGTGKPQTEVTSKLQTGSQHYYTFFIKGWLLSPQYTSHFLTSGLAADLSHTAATAGREPVP